MSRWRKIEVRIWNDEKFHALTDQGKLLWFFLLTHPSLTSFGAMRATEDGIAAELGWLGKALREGMREAFREVIAKGLAKASPEHALIVVPNFLKYNPPGSPNVVRSWKKLDELIPECPLQAWYYKRVVTHMEAMGKAFQEALPEAFREAFREPESSEQLAESSEYPTENDQQPNGLTDLSPSAKPKDDQREIIRSIFELWVSLFTKNGATKLTDQRRGKIRARLRDSSQEEIEGALRGFASDPWRHEKPTHNELGTLLRNREQVEAGLAVGEPPSEPPVEADPDGEDMMDRLRRERDEWSNP